ncbi:MAG TPA: methionine--tRNA ligase [Candidatus Absconditabacterales bacterium]|nr:methionine--tRNA ligase [Candidatus Absconditabacterales bacterium]
MDKKFYITTAIAYLNDKPHIGHALEIVIADTIARIYRMTGKEVEFQTGTDEHGVKNRRTAQKKGQKIQEMLDENFGYFKEMYQELDISYDTFIRTSDKEQHYQGAQELWKRMDAKGDIYKKSYNGLYCAGCEAFKTEKDLIDGKCPDHPNGEIEKIEEENYFFKLSKYKDDVIKLIKNDEYKISPEIRKKEMLAFLENARDISFSRPKTSLPRGVPVPGDEEHVMYVRCDALSNYLTGQGFGLNDDWQNTRPADLHIVGKDIQRFHAAFWPAMLISADIQTPKELLAHGFLTLNGKKMGKSTGNVIDPMEPLKKYGRDAFVFNLLYDIPADGDGDFSPDRLGNVYNSMIIGAWGNLVNRVTKLSQKYKVESGKLGDNENWFDELNLNLLEELLKKHDIKTYLEKRYSLVQKANEYITKEEPWVKYKDESTRGEAIECLEFLLYVVKNLTILSAPVLTDGFEKMKNIFGSELLNDLKTDETVDSELWKKAFEATEFDVNLNPEIIYPRVEE